VAGHDLPIEVGFDDEPVGRRTMVLRISGSGKVTTRLSGWRSIALLKRSAPADFSEWGV
jgi:hypothetical protein